MKTMVFDPAPLFRTVWRTTLDELGWAVLVPPEPFDGLGLRREMLRVLAAFGEVAGNPFVVERLGRFDQQVTTKFHRDGAPPASLLVLGYEPTTVRSRLFVADACQAAADAGVGVNAFLSAYNPMFSPGEAKLQPFMTEVTWPRDRGAIVIVNNSLFPDGSPSGHPLGLLHKGVIETPDPAARRVINSLGATPDGAGRAVSAAEVERWVGREGLD